MTPERIEWNLENWADWMQSGSMRLSYPKVSAGFVGGGYSADFDSMCDVADIRTAEVVEAILEGIPIRERLSVHNKYLCAVWKIKDEEEALESAKKNIGRILDKRGIF